MANTNAFTMRRKNEALYAKYRTILDELAESSKKKNKAYKEYLIRLNEVLPRNEKSAVSAEILAARLSQDEEEQKSICKSILGLASYAAILRELTKHYGSQNVRATFPDLYMTSVPVTRHYAELNEEGDIIRKWDTTSTETYYYLKKEG